MNQMLYQIALVVRDYDEAISFYVDKLKFELLEDTPLSKQKRWVRIKPRGNGQSGLLLAKAKNENQAAFIGNQTGGRVFLFLHTDDFDRDYANLLENQIVIIREPSQEEYGKVCVFSDLYGNFWDLIEPKSYKIV